MRLLYVFNAVRQKSFCLYTCTLCTERNLCAAKWIRGFLDPRIRVPLHPAPWHLGSPVSGSCIVACQTGNAIRAVHKTCPKSGELAPLTRCPLDPRPQDERALQLSCAWPSPSLPLYPSIYCAIEVEKKFAFARNESWPSPMNIKSRQVQILN